VSEINYMYVCMNVCTYVCMYVCKDDVMIYHFTKTAKIL